MYFAIFIFSVETEMLFKVIFSLDKVASKVPPPPSLQSYRPVKFNPSCPETEKILNQTASTAIGAALYLLSEEAHDDNNNYEGITLQYKEICKNCVLFLC